MTRWKVVPSETECDEVISPAHIIEDNEEGASIFTVDAGDYNGLSDEVAAHIVRDHNRGAAFEAMVRGLKLAVRSMRIDHEMLTGKRRKRRDEIEAGADILVQVEAALALAEKET